jgi:hypothetical protein
LQNQNEHFPNNLQQSEIMQVHQSIQQQSLNQHTTKQLQSQEVYQHNSQTNNSQNNDTVTPISNKKNLKGKLDNNKNVHGYYYVNPIKELDWMFIPFNLSKHIHPGTKKDNFKCKFGIAKNFYDGDPRIPIFRYTALYRNLLAKWQLPVRLIQFPDFNIDEIKITIQGKSNAEVKMMFQDTSTLEGNVNSRKNSTWINQTATHSTTTEQNPINSNFVHLSSSLPPTFTTSNIQTSHTYNLITPLMENNINVPSHITNDFFESSMIDSELDINSDLNNARINNISINSNDMNVLSPIENDILDELNAINVTDYPGSFFNFNNNKGITPTELDQDQDHTNVTTDTTQTDEFFEINNDSPSDDDVINSINFL